MISLEACSNIKYSISIEQESRSQARSDFNSDISLKIIKLANQLTSFVLSFLVMVQLMGLPIAVKF